MSPGGPPLSRPPPDPHPAPVDRPAMLCFWSMRRWVRFVQRMSDQMFRPWLDFFPTQCLCLWLQEMNTRQILVQKTNTKLRAVTGLPIKQKHTGHGYFFSRFLTTAYIRETRKAKRPSGLEFHANAQVFYGPWVSSSSRSMVRRTPKLSNRVSLLSPINTSRI